jgi:hypothetical protein
MAQYHSNFQISTLISPNFQTKKSDKPEWSKGAKKEAPAPPKEEPKVEEKPVEEAPPAEEPAEEEEGEEEEGKCLPEF